MDEIQRADGGLVLPIYDRNYLAGRAREARASMTVLQERIADLERRSSQAADWLEHLRLLALLALLLGIAGLWLYTLWVVVLCWLAARAVQGVRAGCLERLERVRRQTDACRIELRHLRRGELYVPT